MPSMQTTLIDEAMRRRDLSSAALRDRLRAHGVTVTRQTVRNWRLGVNPPPDKHRATVAAVLGLDLPSFLLECAGLMSAQDAQP